MFLNMSQKRATAVACNVHRKESDTDVEETDEESDDDDD